MKKQIENIIKENLPERKEAGLYTKSKVTGGDIINYNREDNYDKREGFNQALSQIPTSLIADEVLKVVRKITKKLPTADHRVGEPNEKVYWEKDILRLLSTLSPNKENENNDRRI